MLKKWLMTAALALQLVCGAALAADVYPSRAIKFVVPYPPGGITDLMARLLQAPLQAQLGVPVIIENRPGAGGNIGSDAVAKAAPDGYTILLAASGPMAVNVTLYKSLPYDPLKDFAPIIQISALPMVLEVHPSVPAKDLKSFIELVKSKPDAYSFASAGNGTPQHLVGELFNAVAGTKMQHIPYKGAGPALNDVIGGQVPVMFDILGSSLQYIKAGRLHAIGVTTAARSSVVPQVPTLAESGLANFDFFTWHGIVAPAATPKAIIDKLNHSINEIFAKPEFKKRWEDLGTPIIGGSPEKFGALIRSETIRLGKIVKQSGAIID